MIKIVEATQLKISRQWEPFRFVSWSNASQNPYRKGKMPSLENYLPLLSDSKEISKAVAIEAENRAAMFVSYYQSQQHGKITG